MPFTPATGRRLLVRPGADAEAVRAALAAGLLELCRRHEASSVHVTFMPEPECAYLATHGFLRRTDQQFHWENAGYATFDAFLEALSSRKRKTIKRERRDGAGERHQRALADRQRPDRGGLGRVLRLLHGDRLAQMGPALSHPRVLFADRPEHGRPHRAHHGEARRPLDRRRHQFHRLGHAVRPPLGRDRAPSVPAFRDLLLPGDRIRDRQQARPRRGRRPGRAQAGPRLPAGDHPFRPLHRQSRRCGGRSPTTSPASAPMWRRPARSLRRPRRSARI